MFYFLIFVGPVIVLATKNDPVNDQILLFKERHVGPIGKLTNTDGAPVEYTEANDSLNISSLINNEYFMDIITHLSRERIPERVVHAKGGGAFGYFEVFHDITDICKAELFDEIGKKTPIAVRFSPVAVDKGGSDLNRDTRGFAIKFYTREGNWDIVGLNTPIFLLKDPLLFPNFVHSRKRNPATSFFDNNMFWDFLSLNPTTLFQILYVFSDPGIPLNYRYMPGFSIHTYQVENSVGEAYFVRIHIIPDLGIKNLLSEEAREIGADDPDYFNRDLYRSIERGNFPTWSVSLQVLSVDDMKSADFDIFDVTRVLPEDKYPLRPLGRLVLDKNPINSFAEVEQLAFCPGNLVPGILGAPDKIFEARRLSYRDTQYYRLGTNFQRIPVNCPYRSKSFTYVRDGAPTFDDNGRDAPNYYPNSFYGPIPYKDNFKTTLIEIRQIKPYNFDQIAQFLDALSNDEQNRLVRNLLQVLGPLVRMVQERAINVISSIHPDIGNKIAVKIYTNRTLSEKNTLDYI